MYLDVRGLFFFFDLSFLFALFELFLFLSFVFFDRLFDLVFLVRVSFFLECLSSLFIRVFPAIPLSSPTGSSAPNKSQNNSLFIYFYFKKQGLPNKRNPPRLPLLPPHRNNQTRQHPHNRALNDRVDRELSRQTPTRTFTFPAPSYSSSHYKPFFSGVK
jgi:hypothetical protein